MDKNSRNETARARFEQMEADQRLKQAIVIGTIALRIAATRLEVLKAA